MPARARAYEKRGNVQPSTSNQEKQRVRGIEPPCAAWEAAVLPLNYTRRMISDFRFSIADCNRNKLALQIAVACAFLSESSQRRMRESAEDSGRHSTRSSKSLPRNHVVG